MSLRGCRHPCWMCYYYKSPVKNKPAISSELRIATESQAPEHTGLRASGVRKAFSIYITWSQTESGSYLTPSKSTRTDYFVLSLFWSFFLFYTHLPSSGQLIVCKKVQRKWLLAAWEKKTSFILLCSSSPKVLGLSEVSHGRRFPLIPMKCDTNIQGKWPLIGSLFCGVTPPFRPKHA